MTHPVALVGPLDRILYFRTLPAFDDLPAASLGAMAQSAREAFFTRGSVVISPDAPPDALYVIVDGEVTVGGDHRAPALVGPGEAVGLVELLARRPAGMDVRATRDTLALELDWDAQLDICERHVAVVIRYLRYLARTLLGRDQRSEARPAATIPSLTAAGPLTFPERLFALRACPAFPPSMVDALAELTRHVAEVRLAPGELLWHAGDPPGRFYVIAAGTVAVTQDGDRPIRLRAGTVGLLETLAETPRAATATAESPLIVLGVEVEPLLDILEDHFDFALGVLQIMASQVLDEEGGP